MGSDRGRTIGTDFIGVGIFAKIRKVHRTDYQITQLAGAGIDELMRILAARRTSDDRFCVHQDFVFAESQNALAIDDINHLFVAAVRVIGERRLARRNVKETISQFFRAKMHAHALAPAAEG